MNTQTISHDELTLDELENVNGGWSLNPFDLLVVIADVYYDAKDAGENRRARQQYAVKTGETNGQF